MPTRLSARQTARLAYETAQAVTQALGGQPAPAWDDAKEWEREGAMRAVVSLQTELELTPQEMHARWSAQWRASGWKWGPVRDEARRMHPHLCEYGELPEWHRVADVVFATIARQLREPI